MGDVCSITMARPRKLSAWEFEALELGLDPASIKRKVTQLRYRKARKFGVSVAYMEAVYGWDLEDMAASLVQAIRHGRCRGPRCKGRHFKDFDLELITCDILDPEKLPMWCVNVGWACSQDNKGDGARPLAWRIERMVQERTLAMQIIETPPDSQQSLF